jgi:hypothetical protein
MLPGLNAWPGSEKKDVAAYGSRFSGFLWVSWGYFLPDPSFSLDNYGSYQRK